MGSLPVTNSCDGCARGLIIVNGLHVPHEPDDVGGRFYCTRSRYEEKLPRPNRSAKVPPMRTLTTEELISETLTRIALNSGRQTTKLDRDFVTLVAEMIAISREKVPDCYEQATPGARVVDGRGWTHKPPGDD